MLTSVPTRKGSDTPRGNAKIAISTITTKPLGSKKELLKNAGVAPYKTWSLKSGRKKRMVNRRVMTTSEPTYQNSN